MKICFFCHLTVVWRFLVEERLAISTQSIGCIAEKYIGATILSLTIRVYLHSFSCYCLRNTRNAAKFQENLTLQQFKVIQGHRSWCQWKAHTVCGFLLVITCNVSRICYRFRDIQAQNCRFYPPLPCLTPPLGVTAFEFCDEIWHQKTRIVGLPDSKEIMTLAFFVLT